MEKISIIIPVYNVEKYIRRCLDSVITQTYSNLEILLINDGSTDGGGLLCDEYAAIDNRIRVFHKENNGLSSALNLGLDSFSGDYLGFVDSDDWVEKEMYEKLLTAAKLMNVPISVSGFSKSYDTHTVKMVNKQQIPAGVISTENMLLYPLKRDDYMGFCGYVWNKLYRADVINNKGLRFDEKLRYGMDVLFYTQAILANKCTGVYVIKSLYNYYQRNTAISKTKSVDIRQDILIAYKRIEELLNDNGYKDISYWARGFYCYHASLAAEIAIENDDMLTFEKMKEDIRSHLDDYIRTNEEHSGKLVRMYELLNR